MHKKKTKKKLALRKETLRGLSESDLGKAQGGTFTTITTITTQPSRFFCPTKLGCPSLVDGCPSVFFCGGGGGPLGPQGQ